MNEKLKNFTTKLNELLSGADGGDECCVLSEMNEDEDDDELADDEAADLTLSMDAVTAAKLASTRLFKYCKLDNLSFISLSSTNKQTNKQTMNGFLNFLVILFVNSNEINDALTVLTALVVGARGHDLLVDLEAELAELVDALAVVERGEEVIDERRLVLKLETNVI